MILIGQFDSPFVRRVGIALTLYQLPFEHRPWSVFGDTERIRPYNPLVRVPTLVLDDGVCLLESHIILDYLDGLVGPQRAMFPPGGNARRDALRICALATGMADKAVALFYELRLHEQVSPRWVDRCRSQVVEVADGLEQIWSDRPTTATSGGRVGHADIAVAVVLRFIQEAHPGLLPVHRLPRLIAHSRAMEALPVFTKIAQPFVAPA